MYLMDFVNSITLLQPQVSPIIPKAEKDDVVYLGYEESKKLERGLRNSYMGWKSKIVTGIDNTKFDDFIQQLASLGTVWEKNEHVLAETAGGIN